MRIRKHLSAIHLPAVATPIFRRDLSIKHASGSTSSIIIPPPTAPGVSPRIEEHEGKGGVGSGGLTASSCEALKSVESSPPVGLEAAQEAERRQAEQVLVSTCSKTAGIVKVFSSPRATMIGGIVGEDKGDASSMQQQVAVLQIDLNSSAAGAPSTPVSLPTRPKRTKPNPCLKSCSRYYATPQSHQHFQGCMLQEQHQEVQEDCVDAGSKDCSSPPLPQNVDQVEARDSDETHTARKTLQLTDIDNDRSIAVPEQKRATRRPRRTASMKNLDELDGNDDQDGLGNQCRRMDGKGWRCHRKTQPDYSLCDYHLDKFRETNQRKLKSNASAQEPTRRRRVRRKPVKARSLMSI